VAWLLVGFRATLLATYCLSGLYLTPHSFALYFFILLVNWQTPEDHTVGFRESAAYQQWRALLHHFYDPFPVADTIRKSADENPDLMAFGEALVPGYPFWIELTGGARFNAPDQKALYAHYVDQAVQIEAGHLDEVCAVAKQTSTALYLGIIEKALNRGGHSLYCTMVYIDKSGEICSVHRKLMRLTRND